MKYLLLVFAVFSVSETVRGSFNKSEDEERVRFDGHHVYSLNLPSYFPQKFVSYLKLLNVDFLNDVPSSRTNRSVKVRVSPNDVRSIENILNRFGIRHEILTQNFQEWIDQERKEIESGKSEVFGLNAFPLDNFHNLAETNEWLEGLQKSKPDQVKLENIGKTLEGRDLKIVRITFPGKLANTSGVAKPAIYIDYTIHAREWASHAIGLWTINRLLTADGAERELISSFDWFILPVTNPDGFDYTWSKNRMWRKNRSKNGGIFNCIGTDVNRNFGVAWEEGSKWSCQDDYRGKDPFSEKESSAIRDFALKNKLTAYFTFHANVQMWMFPWAYTDQPPQDYDELSSLTKKAADAVRAKYNTEYLDGQISVTVYKAYGATNDWFYKQGVKYNFAVEVRNKDKGFELPRKEIIPTAEENWEGIKVVAQHIKSKV